MAKESNAHIAMVPSPGMGHLIPMVQFAKRLVRRHGFTVTFFVPTDGPPTKSQRSVLDSLPSSINSVFLPPVDLSDLPESARIETRISLTVTRSNPALRHHFRSISAVPSAVAVDLFGTDAFDVAKEFGASPYIFFPSTANVLSFFLHLPKLDATVVGEFRDLTEPVKVPGCIPIPGKDLLDPVQDRTNDAYKWVLHNVKKYKLAEGVLVNSFLDLEPGAFKALQEPAPNMPPVYPIGPLVNIGLDDKTSVDRSECLRWLDDQPLGSVLYVSFGSGGTLTCDQMNELALGLEQSHQRFLWVVRSPSDVTDSSYFRIQSETDPSVYLPTGFLNRTKGRGLVVPMWAPQAEILSHPSTGGFLTHCGWNSTLESIVNGVPLIAWPLYAEQKMNALMLTEDVKVALRVKADENGVVRMEEIAEAVTGLMEGEDGKRVRNRMKELKEGGCRAVSEDGSSTRALDELARKWKNHDIELRSS